LCNNIADDDSEQVGVKLFNYLSGERKVRVKRRLSGRKKTAELTKQLVESLPKRTESAKVLGVGRKKRSREDVEKKDYQKLHPRDWTETKGTVKKGKWVGGVAQKESDNPTRSGGDLRSGKSRLRKLLNYGDETWGE